MLKIGIIGCGAIADSHAWAIRQIAGCQMVGACDSEELMAKLFCERFQVPHAFTDIGEMLRSARPDVVHILTPPQTHYAVARQCLEQGCHVYVEKPMALRTSDVEELFQLAAQKNLKLTVGHDAQFSPATQELRRLVQDGYLGGAPVHLESYYGYDFGNLYGNAVLGDKQHWVRRLPGKLLQNVISHGIARIAEFLPGDQPRVVAHGFVSPPLKQMGEEEIVDELRVIVSDETGATAYFTFSSRMRPNLNQFRIFGPGNGLFLDETQQTVIKLRGTRFKSYAERFVPPIGFTRQYVGNLVRNLRLFWSHDFHTELGKKFLTESFYRSITGNGPLPIPRREIVLNSKIMDAIFEQIKPVSGQIEPRPREVATPLAV
jgi:predicted dehydrogenase